MTLKQKFASSYVITNNPTDALQLSLVYYLTILFDPNDSHMGKGGSEPLCLPAGQMKNRRFMEQKRLGILWLEQSWSRIGDFPSSDFSGLFVQGSFQCQWLCICKSLGRSPMVPGFGGELSCSQGYSQKEATWTRRRPLHFCCFFALLADKRVVKLEDHQKYPLVCYCAHKGRTHISGQSHSITIFPVERVGLRAVLLCECTFMEQTRGKSNWI